MGEIEHQWQLQTQICSQPLAYLRFEASVNHAKMRLIASTALIFQKLTQGRVKTH
jgi:hypothetical protein